jgi:hypothetical protein
MRVQTQSGRLKIRVYEAAENSKLQLVRCAQFALMD